MNPRTFEELMAAFDACKTNEEVLALEEAAVNIARREGYPDPVAQAECWMENNDPRFYDDEL